MTRSNHTRPVILGFLVDRPRSGYDIRKAVEASLGNFWNESFGQIYPALKELEAQGLVRREAGAGEGRRQVYAITPAGRAVFDAWLREPATPHVYRVETLVKVFFAPPAGPEVARGHIARFRAEHSALLAKYRGIAARLERDCAGLEALPYWLLTVDCGLAIGQAYVDWCDRAEAKLAVLEEGNHG